MRGMTAIVIICSLVLVVGVLAWFALTRKHPENASTHGERVVSPSEQMFGDVSDRPGSPGAEDDAVPEPGEIAPGRGADNLP